MSTEPDIKKPTPPPKAIQVRLLKFLRPIDVPGKNQASNVTSEQKYKGRAHYVIEYQPWMRHHCITLKTPEKSDQIGYVHESCVASWEPLT